MSGMLIANLPAATLVNDNDLMVVEKVGAPNVTERASRAQVLASAVAKTGDTMTGVLTFSVPNVTTYPPASTGYVMEQDTSYVLPNSATGNIYFGNAINFVVAGNPQGTQVWHCLDRGFLETSSSAQVDMVVRYIQGSRPGGFPAPNTVIQPLIAQAIDQTGSASSVAGGLSSLEVDLQANGLDDSLTRGRSAITVVADNAIGGGTAAEFGYAVGVFSGSSKGFHQTLQLTNPFRDAGIDFRNSPAWTGAGSGTDSALWLRTGQNIAFDTAGGAGAAVVTLSSVAGAFGQVLDIPQTGIQFDGHTSLLIAPDAGSTVLAAFVPWRVPAHSVATLPVLIASNRGALAFATDARNPGEGAGSGTGCLVCLNGIGAWLAVWSGVAPTI